MREGLREQVGASNCGAQLGGAITFDWSQEGLVVTLRMSTDRLADIAGSSGWTEA
jgi:hypothetical protein